MGVVIKGMELPASCVYCPLAIPTQYEERRCFITGRDVDMDSYFGRDEYCPMSESEEE